MRLSFYILIAILLHGTSLAVVPTEAKKLIAEYRSFESSQQQALKNDLAHLTRTTIEKLNQLLTRAEEENDEQAISLINKYLTNLNSSLPLLATPQAKSSATYTFRSANSVQGSIRFDNDLSTAQLELFIGLERITQSFKITKNGSHLFLTHEKQQHNSMHSLSPVIISAIPGTDMNQLTIRWGGRLKYKTSTAHIKK